jgi:hypothetical protein
MEPNASPVPAHRREAIGPAPDHASVRVNGAHPSYPERHAAGSDPERLQLTVEETELVASRFSVASALYRRWLDSGEYEAYAKARLLDPQGQVNQDVLRVARVLPGFRRGSGCFTMQIKANLPVARCVGARSIVMSNGAAGVVRVARFNADPGNK